LARLDAVSELVTSTTVAEDECIERLDERIVVAVRCQGPS
jgi:hypothetical protein